MDSPLIRHVNHLCFRALWNFTAYVCNACHVHLDFFCIVSGVMANSSILDSVATFEKQASNANLAPEWITALKTSGINTLGKLSYAVTNPGVAVTDEALKVFTTAVRAGVEPTLADGSALKRLIFEGQTFAVAVLKASVQSSEIEAPKRLAPPERMARIQNLNTRYAAVEIAGPLEPSHALYDLCMTIFETEEIRMIRYISPSKCLSRQQELATLKPEKEVQLDAEKGSLVVKEAANQKEISISSDLALYQALTRRALAFDLIDLATYTTVHRWHTRMFALMEQAPAPGFQRVSQAQLLRADRQAFVRMGEQVNGALKPKADGTRPLDAIFDALPTDVSVSYFLLPMPVQSKTTKDDTPVKPPKDPNKVKETPAPKNPNKVKKGNKTRDPMPKALQGMASRTKSGKPICYSYNLGRCHLGSKCSRQHVCCAPGCEASHPQLEHQ